MVRKRSRTTSSRRKSRKLYDSDEIESESDLELDSSPSSPAPKRYTLRQRKRPIICEDFDYEDEDELNDTRHRSDDEEYDVEEDLTEVKENHVTRNSKGYSRRNSPRLPQVTVSTIEPDPDAEEMPMENGLIDFEDVIRADVVVNKQIVDYDNIINRSEIELDPLSTSCRLSMLQQKEKGRRGRKPKAKLETKESLGGSSRFLQVSPDDDTNLEVQIDPLNFVQSDFEEHNTSNSNGKFERTIDNETSTNSLNKSSESFLENGSSSPLSVVDVIEKYVPPELDEKEKEVVLSNEYLLGNSFDMSADEFLEKQAQKQNELEEEEVVFPLVHFDDDSNSDDDVVIIEKKPEIIVLDDD